MENQSPAFLFYPSDFILGTAFMDMGDRGEYITLICFQWDKGAISKEKLRHVIFKTWDEMSDELRGKFTENPDGTIQNERLEKERKKRHSFIEKQRENGKKGGRPKKTAETQAKPNPLPRNNPTLSSGLTQKKPLIENEDVNENRDVSLDEYENTEGGTGGEMILPDSQTIELIHDLHPAWTAFRATGMIIDPPGTTEQAFYDEVRWQSTQTGERLNLCAAKILASAGAYVDYCDLVDQKMSKASNWLNGTQGRRYETEWAKILSDERARRERRENGQQKPFAAAQSNAANYLREKREQEQKQ